MYYLPLSLHQQLICQRAREKVSNESLWSIFSFQCAISINVKCTQSEENMPPCVFNDRAPRSLLNLTHFVVLCAMFLHSNLKMDKLYCCP